MELDSAIERPNDTYRKGDPWPEVYATSHCLQSELVEGVDLQIGRCSDIHGGKVELTNLSQKSECGVPNGTLHDSMAEKVGDEDQTMELLPSPTLTTCVHYDSSEKMMSAFVSAKNGCEHVVDERESNKSENNEDAGIVDVGINFEADGICKFASVPKLEKELESNSQGHFRAQEVKYDGNASLVHSPLQNGEFKLPKSTWAEAEPMKQDVTVALWVKCRGKWEAGIRCSRADWLLSTLKSKPAHSRKKYCVVFFPNTKTHSWADMLLVLPIDESPEPLAYGTHYSCLESVKDLTAPRRFVMQKLAVEMLNVTDRLHQGAVTEKARHASTWKEFAVQAFHCELYSDLGNMLVELQHFIQIDNPTNARAWPVPSPDRGEGLVGAMEGKIMTFTFTKGSLSFQMLLPGFIDSDWLQDSFIHWVKLCKNAETAESVETLTKELVDAILWDQVEELWDAPTGADSDNEWKSWNQEVMEWFSSHPPQVVTETLLERHNFDDSSASASPQICRKRQKLEIRRADTQASEVETETCQADVESGIFSCVPVGNTVAVIEVQKDEHFSDDPNCGEGWVEIVVETGIPIFSRNAAEAGPSVGVMASVKSVEEGQHGSHAGNKYRHCMAFIEARGRRCGRWANDGDVYCSVHLSCHYAEKAGKVEQTPPAYSNLMCEGTTNHGERCKHRARFGSLYCKKHRPHKNEFENGDSLFSANNLNGKLSDVKDLVENTLSEVLTTGKEIVLNSQNEQQDNLDSVLESDDRKDSALLLTVNSERTLSNDLHGEIGEWFGCISQCTERAKMHTLYCEKHRPNFLKRARNGKTRLITKEHFLDLLKNCGSRNQKVQLHRACELLYGFMKSALSHRNHVSKDQLMEWILSETSKYLNIGEYLLKLVTLEKEKIERIWGLKMEKGNMDYMSRARYMQHLPERDDKPGAVPTTVRCKICTDEFSDDQALGAHWMDAHRKESQWLFRGYACAICMTSFTNRKVLEMHAKEKHNVESIDQFVLFQCMPCGNHFKNPEQLWVHVLSFHSMDFRLRTSSEQHNQAPPVMSGPRHSPSGHDPSRIECMKNHDESKEVPRKFICRFCGLKFDLLPDLGRHHQAAHMGPNATNHFRPKRQGHFSSAPRRRPGRPRKYMRDVDRVTLGANSFDLSHFPDSDSMATSGLGLLTQVSEAAVDEKLIESQCSSVAEILSEDIQQTKHHPSNLEILSVAQLTCCKQGLHSALAKKFGPLSNRLYLKAARFCSELNIRVEWHREGFICPHGCQESRDPDALASLSSLPDLHEVISMNRFCKSTGEMSDVEESHSIVNVQDLKQRHKPKITILCEDVSFGLERIPVPCVIDDHMKNSLPLEDESLYMPWKNFTYITDRVLDASLGLDMKSSQLGCACHPPTCCPEMCDHVYLFNNDYENAKDIHGGALHGRFPYNEMGHLILEEGYLVYECNSMCSCDRTCHNRILQNGVQIRLEIFRTEKKGWAVRAGEKIERGAFVCEFIGEVLNDQEADEQGKRHDSVDGCFIYDIDAHIDDMSRMNEGSNPYIIDATRYGNVSRFINHSCLPNLVNYQVLVESMDCQLAHVGLYASRDIDEGEELVFDYRYKLLPGDGCPCYCGASNCRGRVF